MVEPVPHSPIQALQHDIGNNRPPPIGTDQITAADHLRPILTRDMGRYPSAVIGKGRQPCPIVRAMTERREPIAQDRLGPKLRHHQRRAIGFVHRRRRDRDLLHVVPRAITAIDALRRIRPSGGSQTVDDAEILEHLLITRLDAHAARPRERLRQLVDQAKRHPTTSQIDRKRQPRRKSQRPCRVKQSFCFPPARTMCITHILRSVSGCQIKKCIMHTYAHASPPCIVR